MIPTVNIQSRVAVYVQIENQIQFAIASGALKGDDQLPSVRQVTEDIGVNPNTVAKAYRDLEVMGLVYTRRGMGVYIQKGVQARCRELCRAQIARRLHEITQEVKAAGISKSQIDALVSKSFAIDGGPYGEVPKEVLALAKGKE